MVYVRYFYFDQNRGIMQNKMTFVSNYYSAQGHGQSAMALYIFQTREVL